MGGRPDGGDMPHRTVIVARANAMAERGMRNSSTGHGGYAAPAVGVAGSAERALSTAFNEHVTDGVEQLRQHQVDADDRKETRDERLGRGPADA